MIRISCGEGATLRTDLFDILNALDVESRTLKWRVSNFSGTAKQQDGKVFGELGILDFEKNTANGHFLEFSFQDILSISDKIFQTFDIDVVGFNEPKDRREITITCFDSSYWAIEFLEQSRSEQEFLIRMQSLHPEDSFKKS